MGQSWGKIFITKIIQTSKIAEFQCCKNAPFKWVKNHKNRDKHLFF